MRSSDGRLGYVLHSQEKLTPEQKQMARRRRILQGRAAQGICILAAFAAISLFAAGWLLLRQDRAAMDTAASLAMGTRQYFAAAGQIRRDRR